MMQPFTSLTGIVAPLLRDDIDTDQIAPVLPMRVLEPDYAAWLFVRWRLRADGSENPDFVLNQPAYRQARILAAGRNFGCGSARESAVWAMTRFGIRCIVARSFSDLYRTNCLQNGVLPVALDGADAERFAAEVTRVEGGAPFTVDLVRQAIACPDGREIAFAIDPGERAALLEGLDEIGTTLKHAAEITRWEDEMRQRQPWLQTMVRHGGAR